MGKRGPMPKNKLSAAVVSDVPVMKKPTKEQMEQERRWRAEDALRTINKAEEYRGDKQLMSDVKNLAQEQMNSLKRIVK